MVKTITIAVDGMGGDHAPYAVVDGLARAKELCPDITILLYGREDKLTPLVAKYASLRDCVTIHHTMEVVASEDKPSQALRRGRKSSMGLAIQAVKEGEADIAVSSGNTGALMALSKFILRTMPGIDRPALTSPIPTIRGECVMLDLGANVECDAHNLVQFAIMGAAYSRTVLGVRKPTVALLNVGVEDLKGKDSIRMASEILKATPHLPLSFKGFIEGDGIASGEMDVVVADGFTGNVALKTAEGTARFVTTLLGNAFKSSFLSKIGYLLARQGLKSLKEHLDPNNHNGGVFLGLNGLVVKSHGGSNAEGFCAAVTAARDMALNDINTSIHDDLSEMSAAGDLETRRDAS